MCHQSCIDYVRIYLEKEDVAGKSVLEVGAYDVNGTVRPFVIGMNPSSYVGVDIEMGLGVDQVCDAGSLVEQFGENAFDIVLCTEVLEHVRNWRRVVKNLKNVIKPGGLLILTTRSKGFAYHGYPCDYWRYEESDFNKIFSDFSIESLDPDPIAPGVFLKARRPLDFVENVLGEVTLYSVMTEGRRMQISDYDVMLFRIQCRIGPFFARVLPPAIKSRVKKLYFMLK